MLQSASRRASVGVQIGPVQVGGGAPFVVQSMTDTDTADVAATVAQVEALARAGSELVRITVNTPAAARAVPAIRERLDANDCRVPLIGDFHYNGHRLLTDVRECAEALAKYRINPGNVGFGAKRDTRFATMIEKAMEHDRPVRIGVNWGSLDQALLARLMDENAASASPLDANAVMREALVRSALDSALEAEAMGLARDRIVLSCKVSAVQDLIAVYSDLAAAQRPCPAPRADRGGDGLERHRGLHRGHGDPAPARHRRHHPGLADSGTGRRPHPRGHRRPGDSADDGAAVVHAARHRMPGVRAHHQLVLPRARQQHPEPPARGTCRCGASGSSGSRTCRSR